MEINEGQFLSDLVDTEREGRKSMRDRVTNSRHGNRRKPSLCWPQGDQTKRKRAGKSPKLPGKKNTFQFTAYKPITLLL